MFSKTIKEIINNGWNNDPNILLFRDGESVHLKSGQNNYYIILNKDYNVLTQSAGEDDILTVCRISDPHRKIEITPGKDVIFFYEGHEDIWTQRDICESPVWFIEILREMLYN